MSSKDYDNDGKDTHPIPPTSKHKGFWGSDSESEIELLPDSESDAELEPRQHKGGPSIAVGDAAFDRFPHTGDVKELAIAIDRYRDAFEASPPQLELPQRVRAAEKLCAALIRRFEYFGDVDDMEQAVEFQARAVELASNVKEDHRLQLESIMGLGRALTSQLEHTGDAVDAELAMEKLNKAIGDMAPDDSARPAVLGGIARVYFSRYMHFDEEGDLNSALVNSINAISLLPEDSPERPNLFHILGKTCLAGFERSGSLADIHSAVSHLGLAAHLSSEGDLDRPKRLSDYGDALLARFEHLRDANDLEEAIAVQLTVLKLLPPNNITFPVVSGSLGAAYYTRYRRRGRTQEDLSRAIENYERAMDNIPSSSLDYPRVVHQLAQALLSKYRDWPEWEPKSRHVLLDTAITLHRQAVARTPKGSRARRERIEYLGYAYTARFNYYARTRPNDRNEAITALEEARNLTDASEPKYELIVAELAKLESDPAV